jgi:hypothetical protein
MEKLQNETAMYTRLVYIDTVGHGFIRVLKVLILLMVCAQVLFAKKNIKGDN